MYKTIKEMIEYVNKTHDFEVAEMVYNLLSEIAITYNAPSNWRDLGEEFAQEYNGNDWIMDNCKLYDFI